MIEPEDLVGKKVIVVTNLKPTKIRDVLSEGMILVGQHKKELELLEVQKLPKGSVIS